METEELDALMVKVFDSFVEDEPFHSSNVRILSVPRDEDDDGDENTSITIQMRGVDVITGKQGADTNTAQQGNLRNQPSTTL